MAQADAAEPDEPGAARRIEPGPKSVNENSPDINSPVCGVLRTFLPLNTVQFKVNNIADSLSEK